MITKEKFKSGMRLTYPHMKFKKREGYKDGWIYSEKFGLVTLHIILSNKVRILLETRGKGNYYIILHERNYTFKEVFLGIVVRLYEQYSLMAKEMDTRVEEIKKIDTMYNENK